MYMCGWWMDADWEIRPQSADPIFRTSLFWVVSIFCLPFVFLSKDRQSLCLWKWSKLTINSRSCSKESGVGIYGSWSRIKGTFNYIWMWTHELPTIWGGCVRYETQDGAYTQRGWYTYIYIDMITINHKCNLAICRTINVYCIIMIQSSQLVTQGWVFYLCSALFYTSH